MAHGRALRAAHQLAEQFAFLLHSVGIGQFTCRLDRLDRGIGRIETADFACLRGAETVEQVRIANAVFIGLAFRSARDRLADLRFGKGDRICLKAVFAHQRVEQSDCFGLLRRYRIAADHEGEGGLRPDKARQALRASGARNQSQLHFGQAELCRRHGNAVMAGQRNLAAAAQRRPVDGRDDRLVARFHRIQRFRQIGADRRLAELGDIGAGKEGLTVAADHDCLDTVVCQRFCDRVLQPGTHCLAECVDRGIVGNDDKDVIVAFGANRGSHGRSPLA